ncbi:MAG TPA: Gfo/Idh/MocA family oxidoreductase [Vicinamibacterales bacterium]|nr:Gfo/Idh/MocA family oxidoreductase [Vicinamibacterales bacterium]
MRVAFLGTGHAARLHTGTMKAVAPGIERWYASRDAARAGRVRAEFSGQGAYASYADALADAAVDAVLVLVPPAFHLDWTLQALAARKHVILEKPPLLRSADFAAVRAAASRADRQVLVAENYFYKPLATQLRKTIARGDLGDLRVIHLNALKRQVTGDWRDDPALSGQGALFEGGIHWISLLASLGLNVRGVKASRAGSANGLDRTTVVTLDYAEGAVATLSYSWEIGGVPSGVRWSACYGTAGTLHFETNGLIGLQTGRRRRLFVPGLVDLLGYRAMLADFFEAIRHNRPAAYTLPMAARDLELVERAYRSFESV